MYYEIEGTNTRILGAMHIVPPAAQDLPQWVHAAYDWAELVCFEHNGPHLQPLGLLPAGSSLQHKLPARTWSQLLALWSVKPGLPTLHQLKPWSAYLSMGMLLDLAPGVEEQLKQKLASAQRKFFVIEEAADVARYFDAIPHLDIVDAIDRGISEAPGAQADFEAIHAAWSRRDLAGLWALVAEGEMSRAQSMRDALFGIRNKCWVASIKRGFLPLPQRVLLAVGIFHLTGPGNLLELLEARGHTVREVKSALPGVTQPVPLEL